MPLAAAHRTHIVRVRLIVVVHVAIVEIDVPRVAGVVGVGSARPIVAGLQARPFLFIHLTARRRSFRSQKTENGKTANQRTPKPI